MLVKYNGENKEYDSNINMFEIAKGISNSLAKKSVGAKIDGKNVFGVMMLGAGKGEKLRLRAISENGGNPEEEIKLLEELRQLIEINKFFE